MTVQELYDYAKEKNILDYDIEKDGGVSLNDCEALSRRVSDVLDEKDPITDAYFLEVSSPGLNRTLFTNEHYTRFIGSEVLVKLNKAIEGTKTIKGILKENNETSITVEGTEEIIIPKDKIKSVNLEGEI